MVLISKVLDGAGLAPPTLGGVAKQLEVTGRLPPVTLIVTPIEADRAPFQLKTFLAYGFSSSILIPVDTFEFTFTAPDDPKPFYDYVKEGDIVTLYANNLALCTGIIDSLDFRTDLNGGETVTVNGRDLIGQLEDHDAVSADDKQMFFGNKSMYQIAADLCQNTRLKVESIKGVSTKLRRFATEPGESKLTALQRHLEFLNGLAWSSPTGGLVIGKPNFTQERSGSITMSKTDPSKNNCLDMHASFNAATIPNRILPIWTGQESVQTRLAGKSVFNSAEGPKRLWKAGHKVTRSVVTSISSGDTPQDAETINSLTDARYQPGPLDKNLFEARVKREFASQNHKELVVTANVYGHFNDAGLAYMPDQIYFVEYERAGIRKEMYLFQVNYAMNEDSGPRTTLYFCNKNTMVADTKVVG